MTTTSEWRTEWPTGSISYDEGGGIERISAYDADHAEICGAFRPTGHGTWSIYVTSTIVARADRSRPATIPAHFRVCNRQQASQWVELIAHLYCNAQVA